MEKTKKEIRQTYSQTFGQNGGQVKSILITADNNREPMIEFSSTVERLNTDNLRMLANFFIEVADSIENDSELKSKQFFWLYIVMRFCRFSN